MSDILKQILKVKSEEVTAGSAARPLRQLRAEVDSAPATRDFLGALKASRDAGHAAVIAEIKKASPSQGVMRADFKSPLKSSMRRGGCFVAGSIE